jgi:hypothetical protein
MFTAARAHRAPHGVKRSAIARAWYPATTLADLKEAQYSRVVVPVEGEGKILVQELGGTRLLPRDHSIHSKEFGTLDGKCTFQAPQDTCL